MNKLIFIHMPKCAGRAIKDLLHQNYDNCLEMNNMPLLFTKSEDELNKSDVIQGHINYEYVKNLRQFKRFTFMRDPLERTISQYNHFMTMKTSVEEASILRLHNYSFLDFVKTNNPNLALWVNIYTVQLGDDCSPIFNVREYLKRAIKNMGHLDFIGVYEKMEESVKGFKEKFNLSGKLKVVGKTPGENKVCKVSEEEREVAKKYLVPDYILYNMALRGMT